MTLYNGQNEEIFSDFIQNIDVVDSHTVIYPKVKYSEGDVIRLPFNLRFVHVIDGTVILFYNNGIHAEITRKSLPWQCEKLM
jgi:hypothetical protein